jgi:signal transduction histidine kinase
MRFAATSESVRPPVFWHPPKWVGDVVPPLLIAIPAVVPTRLGNPAWSDLGAALTLVALLAAVLFRRRYPRLAASTIIVLSFVGLAIGGPTVTYVLATLVAVFTVGSRTDRRWALIMGLVAAIALSLASFWYLDTPFQDVRATLQIFAFVGFAAAAGDASRSRREFIFAITERARRAEETKESEARRRVAEERIRIARDLHDVLAHQIAVINLHASVASQALPARPEDAQRSLLTIRQAARSVLGEIGSLLGVLRTSDPAEDTAGGLGPAPSLAQLDALIEGFRSSGLQLDVRMVGTPVLLEGAVDVVAYRILQEALTNAHKHGADHSALLHIEYLPGEIALTVTNTVDIEPSGATGFGLTGMNERVASVGGRMDAAAGPGPVYRLTAWLPLGEAAVHEQTALLAQNAPNEGTP